MLPEIRVDTTTCLGPFECGQCLRICPMTVFIAGPTKVWKFRETDPADYRVYARYYDQCVMCNKCVETCPVEAITISTREQAAQRDIADEEGAATEPFLQASAEHPAPAD